MSNITIQVLYKKKCRQCDTFNYFSWDMPVNPYGINISSDAYGVFIKERLSSASLVYCGECDETTVQDTVRLPSQYEIDKRLQAKWEEIHQTKQ